MYNVAYIKQKAVEIANNSPHKIIIGIMNHKYEDADCPAFFESVEVFSDGSMETTLSLREILIISREKRRQRRLEKHQKRIS